MQANPIKPKGPREPNPVAKHLRKTKSNLGKSSDQLVIHRNVYADYLANELNLSSDLISRMLKLYDKLGPDKDSIKEIFPFKITDFHNSFINTLNNL